MPVSGHPELQPRVTGMLLSSRPHAGPVRAAIGADADQVEGLHAFSGFGREVVFEQHDRPPVRAGELGPDVPGGLRDGGGPAGFGDDGQVARGSGHGRPDAQVRNAFPGQAPSSVPPERVVNDQISERRQVVRGRGRQGFHRPVLPYSLSCFTAHVPPTTESAELGHLLTGLLASALASISPAHC